MFMLIVLIGLWLMLFTIETDLESQTSISGIGTNINPISFTCFDAVCEEKAGSTS
jgi:hypothetical protein